MEIGVLPAVRTRYSALASTTTTLHLEEPKMRGVGGSGGGGGGGGAGGFGRITDHPL